MPIDGWSKLDHKLHYAGKATYYGPYHAATRDGFAWCNGLLKLDLYTCEQANYVEPMRRCQRTTCRQVFALVDSQKIKLVSVTTQQPAPH